MESFSITALDYLNHRLPPGIEIADSSLLGSMINYLSRHPHPLPILNFNPYNVALIGEQGYLDSLQKASSPYILLVHVDTGILHLGKKVLRKGFWPKHICLDYAKLHSGATVRTDTLFRKGFWHSNTKKKFTLCGPMNSMELEIHGLAIGKPLVS